MKNWNKIALIIFCLITFFVNNASLPTDIMEQRNIVTAREMVSEGNWLVPTMNGELRLEKPPLPTWVAGGIEKVIPDSLAAQRTAAGIMGCVWTMFLFLTARYMSKRDDFAMATVVVFLTCYNLILMGRSATWDIYCHAFMMAGIYYFTRAIYEDHHYRQWFVIAGIFMGLSFLSKGPVSFYTLLLPYLIMLIAFPHPSMRGKWFSLSLMIILTLVIGGWWYIYLFTVHPTEVDIVLHKESGSWSDHNVRPWYYYWRFFLEMGVWALLMLVSLAVNYWKKHNLLKREYLITITWAIGCLVFLSLMPEKKTRYLLPLLAPCSMVIACFIVHFNQGEKLEPFSKRLYYFNGILLSLITLSIPILSAQYGVKRGIINIGTETIVSILMLGITGWLVWATLQLKPFRFIKGIAALFIVAECFLLPTIGNAFGNPKGHSINLTQNDKRLRNIPFYYNKKEGLRIELVYEAHRKILPLNLSNGIDLMHHLPCAIVTKGWAKDEIPASILNKIDTVSIGSFDDNKHKPSDKHYTKDLLCHMTLLKMKNK